MSTEENMKYWEQLKQPPKDALKKITGGRISGMTDIHPQWRMKVATEIFGPCGTGWKYEIVKLWLEPPIDSQICGFATVNFYYKVDGEWSEPIPGIGGSKLLYKEKDGPYVNDEVYKMAVTDALSVAMKALGVGADVYAGRWDGSKYKDIPSGTNATPDTQKVTNQKKQPAPPIKQPTADEIIDLASSMMTEIELKKLYREKKSSINKLSKEDKARVMNAFTNRKLYLLPDEAKDAIALLNTATSEHLDEFMDALSPQLGKMPEADRKYVEGYYLKLKGGSK